jgi:hypothetical protein
MTEFNLDPHDYSLTPLQLMKIRGATPEEINEYRQRQKRKKYKEWGCLSSPLPKKRPTSTKPNKSN